MILMALVHNITALYHVHCSHALINVAIIYAPLPPNMIVIKAKAIQTDSNTLLTRSLLGDPPHHWRMNEGHWHFCSSNALADGDR